MRRIFWIAVGLWLCSLPLPVRADTLQLTDGGAVTGDIVNSDDNGLTLRMAGEVYTNILWTKFSQEALTQLANDPKIKPRVEPFIEPPPESRAKKEEIQIHDVTRLQQPAKQSLFGSLLSSSVGVVMLLLVYAANIYAGFEVAIFRSRPKALVMGVAAVLPVLGPIIFLSIPEQQAASEPVEEIQPPEPQHFAVGGQPTQQQVEEVQVTAASWQAVADATDQPPQAEQQPKSPPQVFQRGQFTFNRRFIETKFPGYFGMTRTGEAKNFHFFIRTGVGTFEVRRITRIAANDVHLEVTQGGGNIREILVPFGDIQEIQLKPV